MIKHKILIILGTRPEAIKLASVIHEFKKRVDVETIVCSTGQHNQMLEPIMDFFNIVPDFDLKIMKSNQDLYDVTTKILVEVRDVLIKVKPKLVLVHGDTTTSSISALAAFYQKIPVAHIEAGLRTNNKYSPWPEEINRQLTGRIATFHFAPTSFAKNNLLKENIQSEAICVTGNTVIDALLMTLAKIKRDEQYEKDIKKQLIEFGYDTERLNDRKLILITGHRRENFGQGFKDISNAIKILAHKFSDFDFVYPVHLNPNLKDLVHGILGENSKLSNVFLIHPLDYLPFVYLMSRAYLILTDSGGIQEEAPALRKPVLVMRDTTERQEALEAGTVKLVGTDMNNIIDAVTNLIGSDIEYNKMISDINPYGDGKAATRIVEFVLKNL